MTKKRTSSKKKPEKSELQKVAFWKGEVSKLRKKLAGFEKRLEELESSINNEIPKKKKQKEEDFREKFLEEHYPRKK